MAMILALSPIAGLTRNWFASTELRKTTSNVLVAAFVGTLTHHAFGSALSIWYFSPTLTPARWNLIMYVYPVERLVTVAIVTIIGAPVYHRLKLSRIFGRLN